MKLVEEKSTDEARRETWARSQLIPYAASVLAETGHDVGALLKRYGIAWPLAAAEVELPMQQHHLLLDELVALSGDPVFALHLGQRRRKGSHGLIEYFWRAAATVADALQEVVARGPLLDENSEFIWKKNDNGAVFGQRVRSHRFGLGRHSNEFFVAAGLSEVAVLTGMPPTVKRVMFEHAAGTPGFDYAAALGTPRVEWDVGMTGFELDTETLTRSVNSADPALLETLRRHVQAPVQARPLAFGATTPATSTEVTRITDALRAHVTGAPPTLPQLAESLGLSARSLQRRLAEEGLTLRALGERVRMQEAERRLRETRDDVSRIATELGFSNASNFARAFRRWAGTTPQAFRMQKRP